ncbi:FAD-dependent thymidylate synthase [Candidatus Woesearchaeota archaeon]|nr:FAD-dependent thymidylate synthase [Candidatus Woesearchaeota archaeon]
MSFTPPLVTLVAKFDQSAFDLSVGAARTCYASKAVAPEQVAKRPDLADKIFEAVLEAGHHTTIQHPHYTFLMQGVSRQFLWSFLHSHPFYNSEQQSQRYVEMKPDRLVIPPLEGKSRTIFMAMATEMMQAYFELNDLMRPFIEKEWFKLYSGRKADFLNKNERGKRWDAAIHKRTLEAARYVIPVAMQADLYHTISGLTLMRYWRMCEQFDAPGETKDIVGRMIGLVREDDPRYLSRLEDPVPLQETPEYVMFTSFFGTGLNPYASEFIREFDARLDGLQALLIGHDPNAEAALANAVRGIFGLPKSRMSDDDAIDVVLDPRKNSYLGSTLNVNTLSKLSRALHVVNYTFEHRLSHTADSQSQRHRMIPGTRPILQAHFDPSEPDCIWPISYRQVPEAMDKVTKLTAKVWKTIGDLLSEGVPWDCAQYLLPNATAVRYIESGNLLNYHHKWHTRLCYLAQEEIWRQCLEEVRQVSEVHPRIGKHIGPPCAMRNVAGMKPICPEKDRYCGVPVWLRTLDQYERVI